MRRWTFLLRPGWLALALVVLAFAYLCFTVLAPWQLGKHSKTSSQNQQIEKSLTLPPVAVTVLLPQQDSTNPAAQWRQVTATGRYLPELPILARLRVVDDKPAFEVLAPFVVAGGPTVLVDRGYLRPDQDSGVPPIPPPPTQTVSIAAVLRTAEPTVAGKQPFAKDGVQQVYSINTGQVAELARVPLAGSYLQLVDGQPGGLGVLGLPHLDAGPFLSYGIQWISFGIIAPILLGYFVFSELRARRREDAAGRGAGQPAGTAMTVEEKLQDRYGRRG